MDQDGGDEISVCLLTYNHAHLIESTLASIQKQTLSGYEIIVSDDCSTDDTWAILQCLAGSDRRIRPIRTPQNLGMPGNANFAIAQTDRPYIALLHHDDLYRADLLEKWMGLMLRYPDVGFVFNAYGVDKNAFIYREGTMSEEMGGRRFLEDYLFPRWDCAVRGTAMIRRTLWEQVGGIRPQFGLLADIDLWMRLAMRGDVGYVDEPIILVRQERPVEYPEEYGSSDWSWSRRRHLYEIHAANRLAYFDLRTVRGRLKWLRFRLRLTMDTAKWLTYGVVRNKPDMLETCEDSATPHDLLPLRVYRGLLRQLYQQQR